MKKIIFLSATLLFAVSFLVTSCGKKEAPEVPIVGTWLVQRQEMKVKVSGVENLSSLPGIGNIGNIVKEFEQDTVILPQEGVEETYEFKANDSLIVKMVMGDSIDQSNATYKRGGKILTITQEGISLPFEITVLTDTDLKCQFVKSMTVLESLDFAVNQGLETSKAEAYKQMIKNPLIGELLKDVRINADVTFSLTKKK